MLLSREYDPSVRCADTSPRKSVGRKKQRACQQTEGGNA